MDFEITRLPGLPMYGPLATSFPEEWGRRGSEGVVVEIKTDNGAWTANFRPGLGGIELVDRHPNNRDAVVIAGGDLWVVNVQDRSAAELQHFSIEAAIATQDPEGWIFSRQGVTLFRFSAKGIVWHTKRLSWDGFSQIEIADGKITGLAYSPMGEEWHPFEVDIQTGRSSGGSFSGPNPDEWEVLADALR